MLDRILLNESRSELTKLILQISDEEIRAAIEVIYLCLSSNKKLLIAGNGGSAADAQHIAGEFIGRFMINRRPLPAIALTTDTSVITCISNDFHFDEIFARQVEALGASGDILWVLSTSGNSINILKAMNAAKKRNMHILAFLGNEGGKCLQKADAHLVVKSPNTPRIQEVHLFAYHTIIQHVERLLFQTGGNI